MFVRCVTEIKAKEWAQSIEFDLNGYIFKQEEFFLLQDMQQTLHCFYSKIKMNLFDIQFNLSRPIA